MVDREIPPQKKRVKAAGPDKNNDPSKKAAIPSGEAGQGAIKDAADGVSLPGLNTILDNVGAAIFIKDIQYRYTYVNRRVCEIFGKTPEEILGKGDAAFFSAESAGEIMKSDRPVIELGETITREEVGLATSDGMARTYWTVKLPLWDNAGRVSGLCGISTDITTLKNTERELRESEEKFRSIYNNIGIGVALIGKDMEILAINPQMQKWFPHIDASKHHICFRSFNLPPRDEICCYCPTVITLKDGEVHTAVSDTPTPEGIRHYQITSSPLVASDGTISAAIEMVEDITERTIAEAKLKKREWQLAESQQVARIGSWSWDILNNTLDWSDETFRRFDKDPKTFIPTVEYYISRIHPDDRPAIQKAIREALEDDAPYHIQPRIQNESGREWVLEGFGFVERDSGGRPVRLAGTAQDITERKLAEEKIRQGDEFVRNILDTVDEGFIVIDRDYRIVTANKAYCSQVGQPCDKVIGSHCYEMSHHSSSPCYEQGEECAVRHVFETGEPHGVLHRHTDSRGGIIFVETKAFPIRDGSGSVISAIETVNNITEKYLLEEERLRTQKLESIGTLAGGIAHDFNNLLQGVFGYISIAKMTLDQKEKSLAMLEQAEKALHMSVNLTSQLLTFSKGGKPVKKRIPLAPVIENAARFALSGSRLDYRIDIDGQLWLVEADGGQLGQVIQNMVLNADQAMPMGGMIEIAARNVHTPDQNLPQALAQGDHVEISIKDSGLGIPQRFLPRIFDPYFTTKERGSGLGLATSYSIIKNHNGLINVRSEVGKGSTFTIYLPSAGFGEADVLSSSAAQAVRRARILVMDDEEVVRIVSGELIRSLGHEVDFAEHGTSAIEKYQQARAEGRPFDILILDLTIRGGMGGEEVVKRVRDDDPSVKVIVSSGYSDDAIVSNYLEHGFDAFLQKPYDIGGLQDVLNSLLK